MRNRLSIAACVAACVCFVGAPTWAAPKGACGEVRHSFKEGIWYFEQGNWERVLTHMHEALSRARDCPDPDKLRAFVPYGRWVYPFTPDVYMGMALARMAGCTEESIKSSECKMAVGAWWSELEGRDEECLSRSGAACSSRQADSQVRCGPSANWWQSLTASRVSVSDESVSHYDEQCHELRGMMSTLRRVLGGEDRTRTTCSELVRELGDVVAACPDVRLPDQWFGIPPATQ